jgi:hypothetical protein
METFIDAKEDWLMKRETAHTTILARGLAAACPRLLLAGLAVIVISLLAALPAGARDTWEPDYCRFLDGQAYGLCNAYCKAMGCHREDHRASQRACEQKLDQFYDVTGTVPPCEICDGPTGPIPCGNLADDPVLDADGPLNLAVINDQPLDSSLVWLVNLLARERQLGRVTQLSVGDVVAGALRDQHYDLIFLGRIYSLDLPPTESWDRTLVPPALRDELDLALQAGSGLLTEWQGASAMFESMGRLPVFQVDPPWGWFAGSVDHGRRTPLLEDAVFRNVAPEHPVMQGIMSAFTNPDIDACYLMWEQEDPSLEVLATVELVGGQQLPAIVTAQRHRGHVVMWLCDWSDDAAMPPFGSDDLIDLNVERFLDNSIAFASLPFCEPGTYGATCEKATSCAHLLDLVPDAQDGIYILDPDGDGPMAELEAYCDMTTDGGGWTSLLLWNRELDPANHTLVSLQAAMIDEVAEAGDPDISPMSDLTELADHIRWSDTNFSGDVLSYRLDVVIPNGGELRLDVKYEGRSMEDSAVWLYVTTAGATNENVHCFADANTLAYSPAELALIPYACSNTTGITFTFDSLEQLSLGDEISSVTLRSLLYNCALLDSVHLYRLAVAVR